MRNGGAGRRVDRLYHAITPAHSYGRDAPRGGGPAEFVFGVFDASSKNVSCWAGKARAITLPPAVAAAQITSLLQTGSAAVMPNMYETDRKAWIRYPQPRWIWRGTAICGVPGEVSRGDACGDGTPTTALRSQSQRGFGLQQESVDGKAGLEGYNCEYDHTARELRSAQVRAASEAPGSIPSKHRRCRLRAGQKTGLEKAYRNYAMEYVRTAAPVMGKLFGHESGTSCTERQAIVHADFEESRAASAWVSRTCKSVFMSSCAHSLTRRRGRVRISESGGLRNQASDVKTLWPSRRLSSRLC